MFSRISWGLLTFAMLGLLAACGCRSGGGPQFLQANKLVSAISSVTDRAPGGQTEPDIVVKSDSADPEPDEASDW